MASGKRPKRRNPESWPPAARELYEALQRRLQGHDAQQQHRRQARVRRVNKKLGISDQPPPEWLLRQERLRLIGVLYQRLDQLQPRRRRFFDVRARRFVPFDALEEPTLPTGPIRSPEIDRIDELVSSGRFKNPTQAARFIVLARRLPEPRAEKQAALRRMNLAERKQVENLLRAHRDYRRPKKNRRRST